MRFRSRGRLFAALALTGAGALALAACSGNSAGDKNGAPEQDPDAEVVIWVDATRQAAVEAYIEANPDAPVKVEVYDASALLTKIQLFNRAGKGWPDAVFTGDPNQVAALSSPSYGYAAELDDLVPADVLDETVNGGCVLDEKTYCLTNDIAQTVLWYDQGLMDEFGYDIPTTWDEYQELGEKVAAEHPGYIIGAFGSGSFYNYFWSSGCPMQTVVGEREVEIDLAADSCTRIADVFNPLLENGTVSRFDAFDPPVKELAQQQKILMLPGPSWYGDHVFADANTYGYADGVIAAAPYPTWEGESTNWSGAYGGGIWLVSSHSQNQQAAVDAVVYAVTDEAAQVASPTYPAYGPAAEAWCEAKQTSTFYAENPCPTFIEQATKINPAYTPVIYSAVSVFGTEVGKKVAAGGPVEEGFPSLQSQLTQLANQTGYAVDTPSAGSE